MEIRIKQINKYDYIGYVGFVDHNKTFISIFAKIEPSDKIGYLSDILVEKLYDFLGKYELL